LVYLVRYGRLNNEINKANETNQINDSDEYV